MKYDPLTATYPPKPALTMTVRCMTCEKPLEAHLCDEDQGRIVMRVRPCERCIAEGAGRDMLKRFLTFVDEQTSDGGE